ncbi:similar to ankyrin 2,3/unc44 [Ectocarpus siliculosus]|uniref:Similar to ankyrin 2,3/unc44 n=1 Tax=Ectocarpus siliculosus TaxID=2880 RepID=D7G1E1_ECTSI|nr:similar to ankyrin 2,3/unc44 [Ectocarpus siliculosus]|eukprot:CBJ33251.1 similar to ankyrin 2,3/unc44 [Ectocarpus siliculosus]
MDQEGIGPLHSACLDADFMTLEVLLKRGEYDVEARTRTCGYTPLLLAMPYGLRSKKLLLSFGCNVNAKDFRGRTAIMHAAFHGSLEMMELLIDEVGDIHSTDKDGDTLLELVIRSKHLGALRLLLDRGVCVNSFDHMGFVPLHAALVHGGVPATKMLVNAGADPFPGTVYSARGPQCPVSPLSNAASNGNADVVRFLVERVGLVNCGGDEEGRRALTRAAEVGHVDVIWALSSPFGGGHRECIQFLISRYDRGKDDADSEGRTIVASAIKGLMYIEVQWLLEKGIDVSYCPVILDVIQTLNQDELDGEGYKRFKAAIYALYRAPAVQSVSWGWVVVKFKTCAKKIESRGLGQRLHGAGGGQGGWFCEASSGLPREWTR